MPPVRGASHGFAIFDMIQPMLRRLFSFLSVVSLLLGVATCVLWVRSYLTGEYMTASRGAFVNPTYEYRNFGVGSVCGGMWFRAGYLGRPPTAQELVSQPSKDWQFGFERLTLFRYPAPLREIAFPALNWFGIRLGWNEGGNPSGPSYTSLFELVMPHWLCVLILALPGWRLWRTYSKRRRLARAGRCHDCGYDLRASPARCPECGTVPASVRPPV